MKPLRWRPPNIGIKQEWQDKKQEWQDRKQEWQDRLRNIGKGKKGVEDTEKAEYSSSMAVPYYDENMYILNMKNDIETKVILFLYIFYFSLCIMNGLEGTNYIKR